MAQLFRFLSTDDRHRSEIFTFMIPSTFILEAEPDLRSRDFTSYNQKWSLSFHKLNGQLSAYLTLKSAYEGMTVTGEYGITLINREHFASNEIFYDKNGKFNYECASQGRKAFVSMETLCTLDFMDERGNIQCELEIKNINTTFSYDTQIPLSISRASSSELKYVSNTFAFGNYEWNVCIQPRLDQMGNVICLKFYLCRLSSLDHLCKIVYRYKLINGGFVHDSGLIEQYSDVNGAANSYRMDKIKELLQVNGKFCVRLDLIKINSVFPIMLYPLSQQPQAVQFYDRDRQAWMMESCIEDNCFVLRLYYTDINNIPSGYVRVLSFNISVRHQQTGPVYVFKKPVIKYYYKRESDDGLEITTTIDASEMTSDNNGYLDQEGGITVEMEWYYSHLLHQPEYSHLDDIIRKQKLQMLREIQTLQNENYSLEKQLHMLQAQGLTNPNPQTGNMQTPQMQQQQQQQQQLLLQQQQQQQGPRTKSFDNPSGSSLSINGANPSLNSTNSNLAALNAGGSGPGAGAGAGASNIVKKYMEQKYGSTNNMAGVQGAMAGASGPMSGMGNMGGMGGMGNMSPQGNPMSVLNDKLNQVRNGAPRGSTGLFGQTPFSSSSSSPSNANLMNQHPNNMGMNMNSPNNQNFSSNVGAGLSSLTSGITSGIANLKLQTGSIASKFMNPFSSN